MGKTAICLVCGKKFLKHYTNQKRKYCSNKCQGLAWQGKNNPRWNGGRFIDRQGYVLIKCFHDAKARKNGYILEHRLLIELHIGRPLKKHEVVHHVNGNKQDNRIENLKLYKNNVEHKQKNRIKTWTKKYKQCRDCGRTSIRHHGKGYCSTCYNKRKDYKNK